MTILVSVPARMDFETRSACDLRRHGAYLYSKHPTTQALVLKYQMPEEDCRRTWHMAHPQHFINETPPPVDLFEHIARGGFVEAHNAFFERVIWANVMTARYGWPEIPDNQWRCSASRASAASLPRDLENAALAMGLPVQKDMEGRRLMLKMSKPRRPVKAEVENWMKSEGLTGDWRRRRTECEEAIGPLWYEDEEDIYRLWEYCDTDVATETALSKALPELDDRELAVWQMDQRMNLRGAKFDLELAQSALVMANDWRERLNKELEQITGISTATKRRQVRDWLAEHEELVLPDTAADTLEYFMKNNELSGRARRICQIVMDVNRTSARKYKAMLDYCDPKDQRARDLLMYHGASTGRWSGKSIQVHNFPARGLMIKDFEEAAQLIKSGDVDWCHALYGDVMKMLSHSLRAAIIPETGRELWVADYSAIEARCVLWLAGAEDALRIFQTGGDIYCDMATGIYGFEVDKTIAKDWRHPDYSLHAGCRQFGKQAILGLGYGMGFLTFLLMCRNYDIHFTRDDCLKIIGAKAFSRGVAWMRDYLCLDGLPAEALKKQQAARTVRRLVDTRENVRDIIHELVLMRHVVNVYRARYPEVKQLWKDQEAAAIAAVNRKGEIVVCGKVEWWVMNDFLTCRLPSGRFLWYRNPEVKEVRTSWGEIRPGLRYMSVNGMTRKWERTHTYGGKIVENITQAVARDIMAEAMLRADAGGKYDVTMSVHDELVAEADIGAGNINEFEMLMSDLPNWAAGCPITAEAEKLTRYKK